VGGAEQSDCKHGAPGAKLRRHKAVALEENPNRIERSQLVAGDVRHHECQHRDLDAGRRIAGNDEAKSRFLGPSDG
jgi:hypothetical protein